MDSFVMIDSSCWIKFFRNSDKQISDLVQELIESDHAAISGMIELELFQGIKSEKQSFEIKELFSVLKYFDSNREVYINAGIKIREFRKKGISIAPSDAIIAEICLSNNIRLLTTDSDFENFKGLQILKL